MKTLLRSCFASPVSCRLVAAGLTALCLSLPALAAASLSQTDLQSLASYKQQFLASKTQAQLLTSYRQALQLKQRFEPKLETYMQALLDQDKYPSEADLAKLGTLMPGLAPGLVAEGTYLALHPDLGAFAKAAAKTPEPADNAYFALMQKAYGPIQTEYGEWFMRTWDYGGCSWLGKGLHRDLFKGVQQLRTAKNPFAPELKQLEDAMLRDLQHSASFCLPKAKVLQEFQQVLPLVPAASRAALQMRLKQLQAGKAPDQVIEFDCNSDKAHCGYGA